MAKSVVTGMPRDIDIGQGYTVRIAALDPATGAAVASVNISTMALEVSALGTGTLASGVFEPVLLRTAAPSGGVAA